MLTWAEGPFTPRHTNSEDRDCGSSMARLSRDTLQTFGRLSRVDAGTEELRDCRVLCDGDRYVEGICEYLISVVYN